MDETPFQETGVGDLHDIPVHVLCVREDGGGLGQDRDQRNRPVVAILLSFYERKENLKGILNKPTLIVAPLQSIGEQPSIFGGRDAYDHFGILMNVPDKDVLTIPAVNVDPSTTSSYPKLVHGVYRLVKGIHRWKSGKKEMPGFFVCKTVGFREDQPWQKIHGSSVRVDLPGLNARGEPELCSHINIHEGGEGKWSSDWSDGCITMPSRFLLSLYATWPNATHGYLVLCESETHAIDLINDLKV